MDICDKFILILLFDNFIIVNFLRFVSYFFIYYLVFDFC